MSDRDWMLWNNKPSPPSHPPREEVFGFAMVKDVHCPSPSGPVAVQVLAPIDGDASGSAAHLRDAARAAIAAALAAIAAALAESGEGARRDL